MIKIHADASGLAIPVEITIKSLTGYKNAREDYAGQSDENLHCETIIDALRSQKLGSGSPAYEFKNMKIEVIMNAEADRKG